MMGQRVMLCIDEVTSRSPELIGLDGEALESQRWLDVFSTGDGARAGALESSSLLEAWVVSCDDVEPINLAAAIKSDKPDLHVCLVTFDACGSLFSRAHTARIDEVLEQAAFLRRYAVMKRKLLAANANVAAEAQGANVAVKQDGSSAAAEADGAPALPGPSSRISASAPVAAPAPVAVPAGALAPALPPAPPSESVPTLASGVSQLAEKPQLAQVVQPQPRPLVAQPASRAFLLSVVSGSGGAGKSTVSALGALVARARGHRTLLLDCDLQFGDVETMVGVEEPLRIDEALAHPDRIERELTRSDRPAVLAAPARLEAAEEVVRELPGLLERLGGMFDVIVANTGAAWAEQHAALLERSSAALFLVDQRASSVRACRHALDLCARCGIATGPFQYALNRCAKGAPLTSIDVSCALQGAPVFELKEGGRDVEDYMSGGSAAELIEMRNELAKSLEHVMESLLPNATRPVPERASGETDRRSLRRRGRHTDKKRGRN